MSDERAIELINCDKETNITNTHQGKFRKGLLDLNMLTYAINCDDPHIESENTLLIITCLDQNTCQESIPVIINGIERLITKWSIASFIGMPIKEIVQSKELVCAI